MSLNYQVSSLLADIGQMRQSQLPDVRHGIAEKMTQLYNAGVFEEGEREAAHEVLRLLMQDAEVRVRKTLSENLKHTRDVPHDIALKLAQDVLEVALPMLEFSTVLTDQDLICVIQSTREIARLRAIARRQTVSEKLSDALVQTHNEDVVTTLVSNKGAEIGEHSLEEALIYFKQRGRVIESMVHRAGLPIGITEKLVTMVSGALRQKLINDYQIPERKVHDLIDTTREQATLGLLKKGKDDSNLAPSNVIAHSKTSHLVDNSVGIPHAGALTYRNIAEELVQHLQESGRLTHSIVLRSLCEGNMSFFEAGIAKLASIPIANAHMLMNDVNPLAFRSLYEKARMPRSTFNAVHIILRHALKELNEGMIEDGGYKRRLVEHIIEAGYDRTVPLMKYIMVLIASDLRTADIV